MNDYIFYYTDGNYIIYKLSDEHYNSVLDCIRGSRNVAIVDGLVLFLNQIRSIVKQEELKDDDKSFPPDMTAEEIEYFRLMKQAELANWVEEED